MRSKNFISILALALFSMTQIACDANIKLANEDKDLIGSPLEKMSKIYSVQGKSSDELAVFDKIISKIHVFKLSTMEHFRTISPLQPEKKHTVIHHPSGFYTIDLSEKSVGVYSKNGTRDLDPVQFQGTPISAAFNPKNNIFVFYDNNNNVSILRMSQNGSVLQSFVGGPQLTAFDAIKAGDLLSNGDLILSLSNKKLVIIDVGLTLTNQKWEIRQELTPNLNSAINWIALLETQTDWVIYANSSSIGVLNISTGVIQETVLNNLEPVLYSKSVDPHLIVQDTTNTSHFDMFFVENQSLQTRGLSKQVYIIDSFLSQSEGVWNILTASDFSFDFLAGSITYTNKTLKSFRLSDLVSRANLKIADKAEILISANHFLSLFPSDMGYATSTRIDDGKIQEAKYFNNAHSQ